MYLYQQFQNVVEQAVDAALLGLGKEKPEGVVLTVEPPRDAAHGCLSTNAAMVLAKRVGMNPRELAGAIELELRKHNDIVDVSMAGPGFINMRLEPSLWLGELQAVLRDGVAYGAEANLKDAKRVNVEYVSANPTGPMHIGHARGAVVGDVLARLLAKAGHCVTKEYYVNDAGGQVEVLARSVHVRYREALGEDVGAVPEGLYPGDYLVPVGEDLAKEFGDTYQGVADDAWLELFKERAVAAMMVMIRADLALLGVEHDVFSSEKAIVAAGKVEEALEVLDKQGWIYEGVLEKPKGKQIDDWEPRPQTLFKSTDAGDDADRPIKKSDGSWTYFTPDIAYHYDKYQRGHDVLVNILGVDHAGYVKRIKAAVTALTGGKAECDILLCNLVKLLKGGQPFKMSKRAGTFVTLNDLIEQVGADVVRFMMLTRKNDAPLDMDLDQVLMQSKDNPVFYVQYAHARCHSVLRHAKADFADEWQAAQQGECAQLDALTHEDELLLVKKLADWPRIIQLAAASMEPHRVVYYVQEVAALFHALWNKGSDNAELRFLLPDNRPATTARLALIRAVAIVIASGLELVGVTPLEELRGEAKAA